MYDTNGPVTIEKLLFSINTTKNTIRNYEEYSLLTKLNFGQWRRCINCDNMTLKTRYVLFEMNILVVS
jgi:hypothetical protein